MACQVTVKGLSKHEVALASLNAAFKLPSRNVGLGTSEAQIGRILRLYRKLIGCSKA
jgi:hypothetical protein